VDMNAGKFNVKIVVNHEVLMGVNVYDVRDIVTEVLAKNMGRQILERKKLTISERDCLTFTGTEYETEIYVFTPQEMRQMVSELVENAVKAATRDLKLPQ
jgi:signal transduction histidine kinase